MVDEANGATDGVLNAEFPEPDWQLAKKGLHLQLNNHENEAEALFARYPDSLPIYSAYSFAVFMDALMSFEEDKLQLALTVLKDIEHKCAMGSGWIRTMKSKVFGGGTESDRSLAEQLETQIILGDSQMCLAVLTFLQHDISGFIKGSWTLRKSWKIYQHVYNDILPLYNETVDESSDLPDFLSVKMSSSAESNANAAAAEEKGETNNMPLNGYIKPLPTSHSAVILSDYGTSNSIRTQHPRNRCRSGGVLVNVDKKRALKKSKSVNSALSKQQSSNWGGNRLRSSPLASSLSLMYLSAFKLFSSAGMVGGNAKSDNDNDDDDGDDDIDKETVKRLMAAASFGYGLFQLGLSLLPPSFLKLSNFLGFGADRQNGLKCLMYARQGMDMRAPLATLALLWYHTIVRPFYAIDGTNIQAGVDAAAQLLHESEKDFGQSALFLFFKGRVHRLNSDIPAALKSFQTSVEKSSQREIKLLSLHDIGWCHLIQLDYTAAEASFSYLKSWSRWSKAFYSYIAGACSGAAEKPFDMQEMEDNIKNFKGNQLDQFLLRRSKFCSSKKDNQPAFYRLLIYEMLYLWNALPSCTSDNIATIIRDCEAIPVEDEPMRGISQLILGCCHSLQKQYTLSVDDFNHALEERKGLPNNCDDAHVSAFAQYELGYLLMRSSETKDDAKSLLGTISQYKGYDFEHRLNLRVHATLKQI